MASSNTVFDLKLNLLINRKTSKVLFAEADKTFIDFLLSLLTMPLGTITSLLHKDNNMVGSLGTLYQSIECLNDSYLVSDHSKDSVLHPKVTFSGQDNALHLLASEDVTYENIEFEKLYKCSSNNCFSSVTDQYNRLCTSCKRYNMCRQVTFLGGSSETTSANVSCKSGGGDGGGFVKGVVTYMVMDDLSIKPMSTISGITLMNAFDVRDLSCLEEKNVKLEISEGVKLVKAMLGSKTVLTDVFLHK